MSDPTLAEKLRANLAALRKQKAPRERIQQELERAQAAFDTLGEEDRKLSGLEQVGAGAQNVLQGVSFGFSDDIMKGLGQAPEEANLFKQQLKDNPAIGYGAQFAGGLLTPPVLKVAQGASRLAKVGTVLGEGAIQGGLAGLGSSEGSLADRAKALATGGVTGAATTGVLAGLTKGGGALVRGAGKKLGVSAPKLTADPNLVSRPNAAPDLALAKDKLAKLEGLGLADEATFADVHPQGEGTLRAAATSNKAVRKEVDAGLGQRANRLANRADDAFGEATGATREGADKSIADFVKSRKEAAAPLYEQALQEGKAFDELANTMGKTPSKAFAQKAKIALNDPDVQRAIGAVKTGPTNRTVQRGREIRHEVMDAAYKQLNKEYSAAKKSLDMGSGGAQALREVQGLNVARKKLRAAIVERAPTYADALETFSDDSELITQFEKGSKAGKRDPSLIANDVAGAEGAEKEALRKGHAAAFRDMTVPNMDLGEFVRMHDVTSPIKTRDAAARFKSAFGEEKYNWYRDQLLGMVELQKLKAGKGESSTIDKLLEQSEADPFAMAQALAMLAGGNPVAGAASLGKGWARQVLDLGARSKQGAENARALTARGHAPATPARELLGALERAQQALAVPQRPAGAIPRAIQSTSRLAGR